MNGGAPALPAGVPEPAGRDRAVPASAAQRHGAIVEIQLARLRKLLADRKIGLELDRRASEWLAEEGYDSVYGARPLKRVIQRSLQNPLAGMILEGSVQGRRDGARLAPTEGLTINGHWPRRLDQAGTRCEPRPAEPTGESSGSWAKAVSSRSHSHAHRYDRRRGNEPLAPSCPRRSVGEEIVITRGKQPIARMVPSEKPAPKRVFGALKGVVTVDPGYFEPSPPRNSTFGRGDVRLLPDTTTRSGSCPAIASDHSRRNP